MMNPLDKIFRDAPKVADNMLQDATLLCFVDYHGTTYSMTVDQLAIMLDDARKQNKLAPLVDGELETEMRRIIVGAAERGNMFNGYVASAEFNAEAMKIVEVYLPMLKKIFDAHLRAAVREARLDEHNKVLQAYAEMIEKRVIKDDEPYNTSPKSLKSPLIKLRYRNDLRKQQRQALKEVTEQQLNQGAKHG